MSVFSSDTLLFSHSSTSLLLSLFFVNNYWLVSCNCTLIYLASLFSAYIVFFSDGKLKKMRKNNLFVFCRAVLIFVHFYAELSKITTGFTKMPDPLVPTWSITGMKKCPNTAATTTNTLGPTNIVLDQMLAYNVEIELNERRKTRRISLNGVPSWVFPYHE